MVYTRIGVLNPSNTAGQGDPPNDDNYHGNPSVEDLYLIGATPVYPNEYNTGIAASDNLVVTVTIEQLAPIVHLFNAGGSTAYTVAFDNPTDYHELYHVSYVILGPPITLGHYTMLFLVDRVFVFQIPAGTTSAYIAVGTPGEVSAGENVDYHYQITINAGSGGGGGAIANGFA